ncbi:MAG: lycopene cyclase domain-containing protein [Flavobacteriales bacterium]
MKPYTYLIINLGCILVPVIFSFIPKRPFYKDWKYFFPANLTVAFLFLVWDYYFTEMGIWGFNPDYLTGIYLANLPLEEVLFFICIPYACVFGYFAITHYVKKTPFPNFIKYSSLISAGVLLVLGVLNLDKWYTSLTFISLAIYLIGGILVKKNQSFEIISYLAILPFFFAANGILTGSFLESPIVWYNDAENLGIRMITIPIEDTFYGMLMILMNLNLYEWLKKKY